MAVSCLLVHGLMSDTQRHVSVYDSVRKPSMDSPTGFGGQTCFVPCAGDRHLAQVAEPIRPLKFDPQQHEPRRHLERWRPLPPAAPDW